MGMSYNHRRGFTIAEVSLAMVVLSVAFVMLSQFIAAATQQRRVAEQRRLALQEAANQLERAAALPWSEVSLETLADEKLSALLLQASPQAKVLWFVQEKAGPPVAKRVRVEVAWPNAAGQFVEPIGLTTYFYPPPWNREANASRSPMLREAQP